MLTLGNGFYWKLAKNNLIRNKQMYGPYVIASMIMSAMFFIIINTVLSRSVNGVNYDGTLAFMLILGIVIMAIFTVGYMLYINSFLIKRRKKEFGLYGILGLEKRHVSKIVRIESRILNTVSLSLGLLCGTVFGRLIFMLLMKAAKIADGEFRLSPTAYLITAGMFIVIFLVSSIYNQLQVRLANPIDLINGEKKGEKKLRGIIPITILGVLSLGAAYTFSIIVKVGALAITLFWPAVLLVIIGTYCLFKAGSQFVLGALKKNEKFYYKPQNFISISSLMYRLKQNASGLFNICILCTMVLITVSGVCSLYFGQETIVKKQNPCDVEIEVGYDKRLDMPDMSLAENAINALAAETGVTVDDFIHYYSMRDSVLLDGGIFTFKDETAELKISDLNDYNKIYPLFIITVDDFNRITGSNATLAQDEIIILTDKEINDKTAVNINGSTYKINAVLSDTPFTDCKNSQRLNGLYFVAGNLESADALRYAVNPGLSIDKYFGEYIAMQNVMINYTGETDARLAFGDVAGRTVYDAIRPSLDGATYSSNCIDTNRLGGYAIYGGLLFLGIFFAILFLVNTVTIMYFKQVSEGYEDRERYVILQKVGMSDQEVKKTINRQVVTLFFLPLAVALIHLLVASNLLVLILSALILTEFGTVITTILITGAIFSVVYVIVFKTTAKVYYRLVKW